MRRLEDLNFYELLDLDPNAEMTEVDRAFQRAVQTYGPDSLAGYSILSEEERGRLISRIRQAYSVLADKERRRRYDEQLRVTGNVEEAALDSANPVSNGPCPETNHSIWERFRKVLPAQETMGARFSRLLRMQKASPELSISSGHYLASVRKMKGISLEEISEKTKIKLRYLEALEREDYAALPGGAYRRYILKALAQAIDLDPVAVAEDFQRRKSR
jgi:DnaJ-class molecular chaperone